MHNFVPQKILTEKQGKNNHWVGYHHDIKPENILLFDSPETDELPTFKLADWGAAELSQVRSDQKEASTSRPKGTLAYFAPDFFLSGKASRPFDMWAIGCAYLELLIWFFVPGVAVGKAGTSRTGDSEELQHDDAYWSRDADGTAHLSPAVELALRELEDSYCANEPPFLFLLALVRQLLQVDPDSRMKAFDLQVDLQNMIAGIEGGVDMKKSNPRSNSSQNTISSVDNEVNRSPKDPKWPDQVKEKDSEQQMLILSPSSAATERPSMEAAGAGDRSIRYMLPARDHGQIADVHLNLDGSCVKTWRDVAIKWYDAAGFDELKHRVETHLRQGSWADTTSTLTKRYLQYGFAQLLQNGSGTEMGSCFLDSKQEWANLQIMIGKHLSHEPESISLVIQLHYSSVCIEKHDGQSFAESIRETIHSSLATNFDNFEFLPRKAMDEIFDKVTVQMLVAEDTSLSSRRFIDASAPWTTSFDFAEHVWLWAVPLLALLVYTRMPMRYLLEICLKDQVAGIKSFPQRALTMGDCPVGARKSDFDFLLVLQSRFDVAVFPSKQPNTQQQLHQTFDKTKTVPLLFDAEKDVAGRGAFGEVFRVKIHPEHHLFSADRGKTFALKKLRHHRPLTKEFEKEEVALLRFGSMTRDLIVSHLATWSQGTTFYLLFDYADSNLETYLLRPAPTMNSSFALHILTQLRNIAQAVETIHKIGPGHGVPSGEAASPRRARRTPNDSRRAASHHDLKPQNVLIFQSIGGLSETWKISDFDTQRFEQQVSKESGYKNYTVARSPAGNPNYEPPDYEITGNISRPYDIWSLGCIFLEVILWAFAVKGGNKEEFAVARLVTESRSNVCTDSFWYTDGRGIKLKPAVVQRLKEIRYISEGWGVFYDLAQLTARMLTINPMERPRAAVLRSDLEALIMQANFDLEEDPTFYDSPHTRISTKGYAPPTDHDERAVEVDTRDPEVGHHVGFSSRSRSPSIRVELSEMTVTDDQKDTASL